MPPLSIMIKPVSGQCNMRCAYCFYRDVSAHRASAFHGVMDDATLEALVRRAFAYADGTLHFAFQGGEPTLAGLSFYEKLLALQRKYNARGVQVHNAIQTNGLLIDDAFAAFFAKHRFLVGLSMDGAQAVHDQLRPDAKGQGTYHQVLRAAKLLQKHQAECNILCVVTEQVARQPRETFEALAPFGYMQFVPCLDGFDQPADCYSLTPDRYGHFLLETFELYEHAFQGGKPISIRDFDNYLQMIAGYPPERCGMSGRCGASYVVEADGGVYPCDFYVVDDWRMGSIREESFFRIAQSPAGKAFMASSVPLHPQCGTCEWFWLCRGGCRREREPFVEGKPALRGLCEGYRVFFEGTIDRMRAMSRALLGK